MNKIKINVLVDADLLLEALLNREKFAKEAEKFWNFARLGKVNCYITDIGLNKIYSFCRRLGNEESADEILWFVQKIVENLAVTSELVEKARVSDLEDFESALEVTCAIDKKINAIVTNRPEDFKGASLNILSVDKLIQCEQLNEVLNAKIIDHSFNEKLANVNLQNSRLDVENKVSISNESILGEVKQNKICQQNKLVLLSNNLVSKVKHSKILSSKLGLFLGFAIIATLPDALAAKLVNDRSNVIIESLSNNLDREFERAYSFAEQDYWKCEAENIDVSSACQHKKEKN